MGRRIYVISDTHFGHDRILTFKNELACYTRPQWDCVEDMDAAMVENWNSIVRPEDIVYHLGDVFFGKGWKSLPLLNGRKRLVLGNHDNGKSRYLQDNFQKIISSRMFKEFSAILTHRPILIPHDDRFKINIHGHIHGNKPPTSMHVDVSVEAIGYKPIDIEQIAHEMGVI